jgi:hypothetical protein
VPPFSAVIRDVPDRVGCLGNIFSQKNDQGIERGMVGRGYLRQVRALAGRRLAYVCKECTAGVPEATGLEPLGATSRRWLVVGTSPWLARADLF